MRFFLIIVFKQIIIYLYEFVIEVIIVVTLQKLNINFTMHCNIHKKCSFNNINCSASKIIELFYN